MALNDVFARPYLEFTPETGERKKGTAAMTTATIAKVLLHACPRCHGDLFFDHEDEVYGCLQCGREVSLVQVGAVARIDELIGARMAPGHAALRLVPASVAEEWNDDAA
jgi:hypothetical protein